MTATPPNIQDVCGDATCRSCGHKGLDPVLDLGMMPLADGLLTRQQLNEQEPTFPLQVAFCHECALVQITETVPPEVLFCQDYPYYSSFSPALLDHSRKNALELIESQSLHKDSQVMEVASNDGYLLKNFAQAGIPVLGIDPADGPAREAEKIGVPTICDFFGRDLATKLAADGKKADVIIGNNVLAHVADTNGLVAGLAIALKDSGIIVIEAPYLRDLVEQCQFDTIYHEHLCYFSVLSVDRLFRRHGLFLNDVRHLSIHGGSLRYYFGKTENVSPLVKGMLEEETHLGMDSWDYYKDFGRRVEQIGEKMRQLLIELKAKGNRIAAYGAAAKGTVMLNYVKIGTETIDFVVDRNIHKQGKYMPGVQIPIGPPERLIEEMPDHTVLLPWNFSKEILAQQADYRTRGGKFIIPIPKPEIV